MGGGEVTVDARGACYTGIVVLLRDTQCSWQRVEMYCCIGHLSVLTRKYVLVVTVCARNEQIHTKQYFTVTSST